MKNAFATMENCTGEESDGGETKNQTLLAKEETWKYDFPALVAITDSNDDENLCQSKDTIFTLMVGTGSEEDEDTDKQSKALMVGTDSEDDETMISSSR